MKLSHTWIPSTVYLVREQDTVEWPMSYKMENKDGRPTHKTGATYSERKK